MRTTTLLTILALMLLPFFVFGQGGFLGIQGNQVSDEKAAALDFPDENGFYVTSILPNTAAARAGIQPFDYIYALDGKSFPAHMGTGEMFEGQKAGEQLALSIYRQGQDLEVPVVLGQRGDAGSVSRSDTDDPFLGIHTTHYSWKEEGPRRGSVPVQVQECSTAEAIGLQDGDRIFRIDEYPTVDWHDLGAAIDAREVGDPIRVYFYRDGQLMMGEGLILSEAATGEGPCPETAEPELMPLETPNAPVVTSGSKLPAFVTELLEDREETPGTSVDTERQVAVAAPDIKLQTFPNPSDGRFTLMLVLSEDGPLDLRIINSQGVVVREMRMRRDAGDYMQRVDLTGVAPGAYFVQVRQGRSQAQATVIIQ